MGGIRLSKEDFINCFLSKEVAIRMVFRIFDLELMKLIISNIREK